MKMRFILGAAEAEFIADSSVDVIVTSPPYWRKRRYGLAEEVELGQEESKEKYVARLLSICRRWKRILKPTGSIFINLDDTIVKGAWQRVPDIFAREYGKDFNLIHGIIWAKTRGMPSPAKNRMPHHHEDIFHFAPSLEPYMNFERFYERYGDCGTVWNFAPGRSFGDHPAPFPLELVERCAALCLPPGGVLYDPFAGSGTALSLALTDSSITAIGSDLKVYERTREVLTSSVQFSLF